MFLKERFLSLQLDPQLSRSSKWQSALSAIHQKSSPSVYDEISTQKILQALAELLLNEKTHHLVVQGFRSVLYPLVMSVVAPELKDFIDLPKASASVGNLIYTLSVILPHHAMISSLVIEFVHRNRSVIETNVLQISTTQSSSIDESQNILLLKGLYKLLLGDKDSFAPLLKLHAFMPLLHNQNKIIRLYAFEIFCLLAGISDHGRKVLKNSLQLSSDKESWESFSICQRELDQSSDQTIFLQNIHENEDFVKYLSLPPFIKSKLVLVDGYILQKRESAMKSHMKKENPYVFSELVPTARRNMESVILAVALRTPVLIKGPHGSGKTTVVEGLASLTGNENLVKIHLGDHVDSKLLLGSYVCTEVPGEFKWQPGALTQAVVEGRWVVIEDIDLAPTDVLHSLGPLLEDRQLFIPGRGEYITVAQGFQLFATLSTSNKLIRQQTAIHADLWTHVDIKPLPLPEVVQVINTKYPKLTPISSFMSDGYRIVNEIVSSQGLFGAKRALSVRDLFKLARRLHTIYEREFNTISENTQVSSRLLEAIFSEAIDCFAGMTTEPNMYSRICSSLGEIFKIPIDRVAYYTEIYKPHFEKSAKAITIGRVVLPSVERTTRSDYADDGFVKTKHHLRLLEKIAVCIRVGEPVLLSGETGTGKTTVVQYLAEQLGQKLIVQNMSQQTDSMDLIGGFKPVDMKILCSPLVQDFDDLFQSTFSAKTNTRFLEAVHHQYQKQNWKKLFQGFQNSIASAFKKLHTREEDSEPAAKVRKTSDLAQRWTAFSSRVQTMIAQQEQVGANFAFTFIEGPLTMAIQRGDWILLDEVNLASAETLERLSSLLEGESIIINERGDIEQIQRHPNFRLFACMNPATDAGKKDLPPGLRNRFSEFYVDEMKDVDDLRLLVAQYLKNTTGSVPQDKIVGFYQIARKEAHDSLLDGSNNRPVYSLRTLTRALRYTQQQTPKYGFLRALYDGFCMSFLTQLNMTSINVMEKIIRQEILGKSMQTGLKPPKLDTSNAEIFEGFIIERGEFPVVVPQDFIITDTIKYRLADLARIVSTRRHPVLIQGATSTGKTSLIEYLASATGHRFVRINNHEHTDIQEYLGSYSPDVTGKLVFQEGILVEAVRKGYWIVLDELNLAPSEILEALNRLLDDNRELFIPEKNETVRPHPHFQLFATQNPAGIYGGRKVLSKAFRNRFVELHYDDIPTPELEYILHKRCLLSPSCAKMMITIMKDLERGRFGSQVFAGKRSYITPRDLFRWGNRIKAWEGDYHEPTMIAHEGYIILAERLRKEEEKTEIKALLEKHTKVKVNMTQIYEQELKSLESACKQNTMLSAQFQGVVWTATMKRMYALVARCLRNKEPVLLVGETGCGKTTVCQLLALARGQKLHMLNCHQHTETADFLGGLRPVRGKDVILEQMREIVSQTFLTHDVAGPANLSGMSERELCSVFEDFVGKQPTKNSELETVQRQLVELHQNYSVMFSWQDGPLVDAMKGGDLMLVDEISLAEDSVLERLNSVLETKQILVLAEKGGPELEEIIAKAGFCILATMNPGGDFGKKELSPALRNRFTELWIGTLDDESDLYPILCQLLSKVELESLARPMLQFLQFYRRLKFKKPFTVRDALSWSNFIVQAKDKMDPHLAYIHGACMVFLDNIGSGASVKAADRLTVRRECLKFIFSQFPEHPLLQKASISESGEITISMDNVEKPGYFGQNPFFITKGSHEKSSLKYSLSAPTTSKNVLRVLRGLQLHKPILLEGSPGVGKTSLITAIAKASGHEVVQINLSEQTDISDLMGADLPVEGGEGGEFSWRDGIFLQAMKAGHWILLDELNLASQSVLEGLNACLDHRGSFYIPELNMSFQVSPASRIFGCQNPMHQGGGRKGLPKSFLNRFTEVYVEQLESSDLLVICQTLYGSIDQEMLEKMIEFNDALYRNTMIERSFGRKGSPWEFNLRDLQRWCELMLKHQSTGPWNPGEFLGVMYYHRMRCLQDRNEITKLYETIFGKCIKIESNPSIFISPENIQIGTSIINISKSPKNDDSRHHLLLQEQLEYLESLVKCIDMRWMGILIGPTASGKTSIVRLLAQLTGNNLCEFSMNSSVDTLELLGGFEQVDLNRHQSNFLGRLDHISKRLLIDVTTNTDAEDLSKSFRIMQKIMSQISLCRGKLMNAKSDGLVKDSLFGTQLKQPLTQILDELASVRSSDQTLSDNIAELKSELVRICSLENHHSMGRFEWVDGVIVQAVTQGHWLLIDNANLCNPSVLDRLNSLFENDGELVLSERGIVNGSVVSLKPHPNFRIFLTMDPVNGDLSRAMRNRGIEICLLDPALKSKDTRDLISTKGLFGSDITQSMIDTHLAVCEADNSISKSSRRDLVRWAVISRELIERGYGIYNALYRGYECVYRLHEDHSEKTLQKTALFREKFDFLKSQNLSSILQSAKSRMIPVIASSQDWVKDSSRTRIYLEGQPIVFSFSQVPEDVYRTILHKNDIHNGSSTLQAFAMDFPLFGHHESTEMGTVKHIHLYARYFLERSGHSDMKDRVEFLRYYLKNSRLRLLELSSGHLCEHSLYENTASQPVFIHDHEDLALIMSRQHQIGGSEMVSQVDRLPEYFVWNLLVQLSVQRESETIYYQLMNSAEVNGTVMNQSYLFHHGLLDKEGLKHPICLFAFPFMKILGFYIDFTLNTEYALRDEILRQIWDLTSLRSHLWDLLNQKDFHLENISNTLMSISKSIKKLTECPGLSEAKASDLISVLDKVSEVLGIKESYSIQKYIRKIGRHPPVFKSEELVSIYLGLKRLSSKLEWKSRVNSGIMHILKTPRESRSQILESIATIMFLDNRTEDSVESIFESIKLVQERLLQDITTLEQTPAAPLDWEVEHSMQEWMNSNEFWCALQTQGFDPRICSEAIWPIQDALTLMSETATYESFLTIGLKHSITKDDALAFEDVFSAFLNENGSGSRPPSDYVPYKLINWMISASMSGEINPNTPENRRSVNQYLAIASHSFLKRFWSSTFNMKNPDSNINYGPSFIFSTQLNGLVQSILGDARLVPLVGRDEKLRQIEGITKQVLSLPEIDVVPSFTSIVFKDFLQLVSDLHAITQVLHDTSDKTEGKSVHEVITFELNAERTSLTKLISVLDETQKAYKEHISPRMSKIVRPYVLSWIESAFEMGEKCISSSDLNTKLKYASKWFIYTGLTKLIISSPLTPVDPVSKYSSKLSFVGSLQSLLIFEANVRQKIMEGVTGAKRSNYVDRIRAKADELQITHSRLLRKIAARPQTPLYHELYGICSSFISSMLDGDFFSFMKQTDNEDSLDESAISSLSMKESLWQEKLSSIIERLEYEKYEYYLDVTLPIATALYQIKHGLRLLFAPILKNERKTANKDMKGIVDLVGFLNKFPINISDSHTPKNIAHLFDSGFLSFLESIPDSSHMSVIRVGLIRLLRRIQAEGTISPSTHKQINEILTRFVVTWDEQEIEAKQKQEEEDQLYQRKVKTIEILSDDQLRDLDYKKRYPDYHQEYEQLFVDEENDNGAPIEVPSDNEKTLDLKISKLDISFMKTLHGYIYGGLTGAGNVKSKSIPKHMVLDDFQTAQDVAASLKTCFSFNQELARSNNRSSDLLMCDLMISKIKGDHVHRNPEAPVDIYHDSDPQEVVAVTEILPPFIKRLDELLDQFPEHPILSQIKKVCQRVLSFSLSTPFVKVLIGLELLLRKGYEWEAYASRHVTVNEYLSQVSKLIQKWRKRELDNWKNTLNARLYSVQTEGSRWWLHLYKILNSSFDSTETIKNDLFQSLDKFMQSSPIGEFEVRLQILHSFHRQMGYESYLDSFDESTRAQKRMVANILYNVSRFYSFFSERVSSEIASKRAPIEKDLEDFIKISKWDDVNYYAIKESTEKTHRKLHKLGNDFEEILKAPVLPLLGVIAEPWNTVESTIQAFGEGSIRAAELLFEDVVVEVNSKDSIVDESAETPNPSDASIQTLSKMPFISKKIESLAPTISASTPHKINAFATVIIERIQELRETSKFKSAKIKSFVDLLRNLKRVGVSYLAASIPKDELNIETIFCQEPFAQNPNQMQQRNAELGSHVDRYFYRNIHKLQSCRQAAAHPKSKDLTRREVTVSSQFAEHLFYLGLSLRRMLSKLSSQLFRLKYRAANLSQITGDIIPSQIRYGEWIGQLAMAVQQISNFFSDITLLSVIREEKDILDVTETISNKAHDLLELATKLYGFGTTRKIGGDDITLLLSDQQLDAVSQKTSVLISQLQKWFELSTKLPSFIKADVGGFKTLLQESIEKYGSIHNEHVSQLAEQDEASLTSHIEDLIAKALESVMTGSQRVIQDMEKRKVQQKPTEGEASEASEQEQMDDDLDDNEIMDTYIACQDMFEKLKLAQLDERLESLVHFMSSNPRIPVQRIRFHIANLVRVISSHSLLISNVVGMTSELAKSILKLDYILINVFTGLYNEGYCDSPEEQEGDGETQETKSGGTGLGEGEGDKDISEQIEDEDQLLGSKQKDQQDEKSEKKSNEKQKQDTGIEVDVDFEGEFADVEQNEENEEDEESEDENKEELDRQMGDLNKDDEEVVDEKFWDEKEDEDKTKPEDEKRERNSSADNETGETDIVAKDENDPETPDKEDKEKEKKSEKKEKPQKMDKGGPEEETDFGDEEEEHINEDGSEKYEDNHGLDLEQPNELELPDDLNLDEGNETNENDEMKEDDANGEDKLSDEQEGEDAEKEDDSNPQTRDEQEIEQQEADEENQDKQDELKKDGDASNEDKMEENNEQIETNEGNEVDQTPAPFNEDSGVASASKLETLEQKEAQGETQGSQTMATNNPKGEQTSQRAENMAQQQQSKQQPQQNNRKVDVNPFRSLGDVSKEWLRRAKVQDNPTPEKPNDQQRDTQNENVDMEKDATEFEFVVDDNQKEDTQVMAPADESQMKDSHLIQEQEEEKKAEDTDNKDDEMETEQNEQSLPPGANATKDSKKVEKPNHIQNGPDDVTEDENDEMAEDNDKVENEDVGDLNENPDTTIESSLQSNLSLSGESSLTKMTPEELQKLREELENELATWRDGKKDSASAELMWRKFCDLTADSAQDLCEKLRLILEPTLSTKLKGDYKSGKRINMKKVIPYIASHFKKDKIWMRRTKPSKRTYQVLLAIDDSLSMKANHAGDIACEALALISRALTRLEVGQMSIVKFGEELNILHPFDAPFTDESGAQVLREFQFNQQRTNYMVAMKKLLQILELSSQMSQGSGEPVQLTIIVSDGHLSERSDELSKLIREATSRRQLLVFIILDHASRRNSVLTTQSVSYRADGKMAVVPYLDLFPFPYYIILRDIHALPDILADALRQWFQMITNDM